MNWCLYLRLIDKIIKNQNQIAIYYWDSKKKTFCLWKCKIVLNCVWKRAVNQINFQIQNHFSIALKFYLNFSKNSSDKEVFKFFSKYSLILKISWIVFRTTGLQYIKWSAIVWNYVIDWWKDFENRANQKIFADQKKTETTKQIPVSMTQPGLVIPPSVNSAQRKIPSSSPHPVMYNCENCKTESMTKTKPVSGATLTKWVLCTCLVCLLCGCCCLGLIPCCMDDMYDVEHYCGKCNKPLGTYVRPC